MSDLDFYKPQRQSKFGIVLIFATALFHILRNFWFLGVYFLVGDFNPRLVLLSILGFGVLLLLAMGYSVLYYLRFRFFIDPGKKEFVLQKGVFSSEVIHIPFHKIQQVNFNRNILQRIIGVYSIQIDTAGSKDKEVGIKALSKEKADVLAALLLDLSAKEMAAEGEFNNEVHEEEAPGDWEYKLPIARLLKLGLTSNYLRGLALLVAFYFSLREQFRFTETLFEGLPDPFMTGPVSTFVIFLFLFLVGMAITVAETFIKYYRLRLKKTHTGLQVAMGLRHHTKVNLKARRVQLMQLATNPLQKRLDLYKLKISLASSQNDPEKDQINVPGVPASLVSKVHEYFYGPEPTEKFTILPLKLLLFRRISRGLIPLFPGLVYLNFSETELPPQGIWGFTFFYVVLMILYQLLYFKNLKLSVSENFLVKYSGVWIKKKEILEMYKLQSVSVIQPIWYKDRELVNLRFHSAGGDVTFKMVNKKEILPLVNYLLYRIEASSKAWM